MAGPKYDAAIDAELTNDPVFMGYVGWSGTPTEAEYQAIADLLNDNTLRDGGDAYVPTHVFMGAIKPSAWPQGDGTAAVDEKARAHRDYLLALTSGDIIDLGNLEIQSKLKSFGVEPKRLGEIMVEKGYLRDGDVQAILEHGMEHGRLLVALVDEVVRLAGWNKHEDIKGVCVSQGPGSFTGLRIAIATATGSLPSVSAIQIHCPQVGSPQVGGSSASSSRLAA